MAVAGAMNGCYAQRYLTDFEMFASSRLSRGNGPSHSMEDSGFMLLALQRPLLRSRTCARIPSIRRPQANNSVLTLRNPHPSSAPKKIVIKMANSANAAASIPRIPSGDFIQASERLYDGRAPAV